VFFVSVRGEKFNIHFERKTFKYTLGKYFAIASGEMERWKKEKHYNNIIRLSRLRAGKFSASFGSIQRVSGRRAGSRVIKL
jgi:hypothetical protein